MTYALFLSLVLVQQNGKDLPAPVQQTVTRELGGAAIKDVQKEADGSYTIDTKTATLRVLPTGELISKKEQVPADKLPKAVQDTIKKELAGKKVDTEKLTKVYYEASMGNTTLRISEDGKVTKREEKIKPAELPEAVAKAAKSKFEGATITKARKVTEDGHTRFEVTAETAEKKKVEAVFTEEGKEIF
jgi:hypothetical protein